jgi:hypothetical protein
MRVAINQGLGAKSLGRLSTKVTMPLNATTRAKTAVMAAV